MHAVRVEGDLVAEAGLLSGDSLAAAMDVSGRQTSPSSHSSAPGIFRACSRVVEIGRSFVIGASAGTAMRNRHSPALYIEQSFAPMRKASISVRSPTISVQSSGAGLNRMLAARAWLAASATAPALSESTSTASPFFSR